ncbi:NB-ARC domain-containing protein [Stenotrophomonas sp. S41]|uniref:tetratricopeptide repeat protein n=1 Tax=Stenotrophomonas sp. S41 TaxID=2767464 RepID=UPI00190D1189|nr:NB-ARC domain-containing protein [Stenotrophomonas sp. S41]MBK0013739.1 AAA family ATPase [Stenotrophomonas sp. S41]
MAFNLSRMTTYALLSALEHDLKTSIRIFLGEDSLSQSKLDKGISSRALDRLEKDVGFEIDDPRVKDVVEYLDFGDTFQIINSQREKFPTELTAEVKHRTSDLEKVVAIRNRVMHFRPLNVEDLPFVTDLCEALHKSGPSRWPHLDETLEKLSEDASYVLRLEIPANESEDLISHNLPIPDFDETGLVGRDDVLRTLKQLCLGNFPVISIVGEGGVGKSALALKVAYELLEDKSRPFDAIVWVSSKTTQIAATEIRDIHGAITSSIGVLGEVSSYLGAANSPSPLEDVIEYLKTFKIALFIDNLETILDDTIRQFVSALPNGSKLIITSRIGLGAYEYPIKLPGIEEKYGAQLLRMLGRIRNCPSISKQDDQTLRRFATRMHLNPGYIKWFVSAVQAGATPEAALQNSSLFLEFCMSNVYNFLSQDARDVTSTMQCAPGYKDIAELSYLTGFNALRIQKSLQVLLSTNMLAEQSKSAGGSIKTTYQLSELARAYLNKYHRPSNSFKQRVNTNRNKLTAVLEGGSNSAAANKYSQSTIKVRLKSDRVVAKMLRDALSALHDGKNDHAYEILEESRRLSPDYFEVARVTAFFHEHSGNLQEARDNYELALQLSPQSAQIHYWYGKFLLYREDSVEEAMQQFEAAHKFDPASPEVGLSLARSYMFLHRFEDAWEIVDAQKVNLESMSERHSTTYFDLRVQLNYRAADDYSANQSFSQGLDKLNQLKIEYDAIPNTIKITPIRQKLSKIDIVTQRLARGLQLPAEIQSLKMFEAWRQSRQ